MHRKTHVVIAALMLLLIPVSCNGTISRETSRRQLRVYQAELNMIRDSTDTKTKNGMKLLSDLTRTKPQLKTLGDDVKEFKKSLIDKALIDAADRLIQNCRFLSESRTLIISQYLKATFLGSITINGIEVKDRQYPYKFVYKGREISARDVIDMFFWKTVDNSKQIMNDTLLKK